MGQLVDGDERVRFCFRCTQNVYDLRAMGEEEAEAFLASHVDDDDGFEETKEGERRFFRRPDGTVLLTDCPVGMQRRHSRTVIAGALALAALIAVASIALANVRLITTRPVVSTSSRIEPPRRKVVDPSATTTTSSDEATDDSEQERNQMERRAAAGDELVQLMGGNDIGVRVEADGFDVRVANRVPTPSEWNGRILGPTFRNTYIAVGRAGSVPLTTVSRVVGASSGRFRACYVAFLEEYGTVLKRGQLRIAFTINSDGAVRDVGLDGMQGSNLDPPALVMTSFMDCIKAPFNMLAFPPPTDGRPVRIGYGFIFFIE